MLATLGCLSTRSWVPGCGPVTDASSQARNIEALDDTSSWPTRPAGRNPREAAAPSPPVSEAIGPHQAGTFDEDTSRLVRQTHRGTFHREQIADLVRMRIIRWRRTRPLQITQFGALAQGLPQDAVRELGEGVRPAAAARSASISLQAGRSRTPRARAAPPPRRCGADTWCLPRAAAARTVPARPGRVSGTGRVGAEPRPPGGQRRRPRFSAAVTRSHDSSEWLWPVMTPFAGCHPAGEFPVGMY